LDAALRLVELAFKLNSLSNVCVTENAASTGTANYVAGLRGPAEILRLRPSRKKQGRGQRRDDQNEKSCWMMKTMVVEHNALHAKWKCMPRPIRVTRLPLTQIVLSPGNNFTGQK
jgi:hypothetical protein